MFSQLSKVLVALFLHITPRFAVPLSDFYPYGVSEGDTALPANDDGSSGVISISILFPYFDRNHDSLYVNTNGVVSFLVGVSQYTPAPFPLGDERRLISPFWGDVDTRNGGTVSYRESTDPVLLQRATNDVRRSFLAHQKFSATWIFIATWDRVAFFGASESAKSKVNTFQAVLVTDGRHSFAIFNYNVIVWTTGTASGGDDDTGLGGTPAQGGFNAGDGIRFFVIPGSRTSDILNLPSTSNVARAGQWMFRTDEASVEAGGCDSRDSGSKTLTLSPRSGIMLGGTNIKMSGPCFTADDNIVVQIDNEININATFGSELQSSVTVPVLNKTGRLPIKLSIDGGNSFDYSGVYTSVPINRYTPGVQRTDGDSWQEDSSVDISWNPDSIGSLDDEVSIDLARYKMDEDDVPALDSFHTAVDSQLNNGHSQFVITTGQGDGNIDDRFINLVRVSRKSGGSNVSQSQWVWSDVFAWKNMPWANDRCSKWHLKEPSPDKFTGDSSLQPCPRILTQAMADRGRFMSDEECNPSNRDGCARYHEGAVHCFKMVNPSSTGAGQQCCYNNFGNLMMGKHAGSLDRVHPNAGIPVISHFFHDIVPYQDCCRLTNNCKKYFEKRPSDDGSQYQAPRPATGFGDPHMVTLDGTPFTFNGYGEYFILKVSGVDFALQGRMEPLVGDDGSSSRATVYTAFAAQEQGSDTVQIQLNGRGLVDVLVNGEAVIFDELSLLEFNGVSVLQYVNTSMFSAIFNSGISVTVEGQEELLGLVTLVPTIFKGNTTGLLGFWDDSQESEFLRPDGTFLSTNVSLEVIHRDFGQLWVTRPDESLFVYQQGQSHSTFHHPSYKPIFPDSQSLEFTDKALEKEAQDICGESSECLFDIFTTGKVRIGKATKETVKQFVAVVNDTVKPACVPLDSQLADGVVHRNDTEGGIDYTFECNRGFVMNGSNHVKCEDGVYNGSAPNCLPKECPLPAPSNLNNGVADGDGSVYRSTYYFTCNDGFVLLGHSIVSCTEDGSWNGTTPRCLKECPVLPLSMSNGDVHGSGHVQGSRWRFSCHRGYGLVGHDVLQCTEQGNWNAGVPTCLRECPLLPSSIANGFVNGRGSVEGSQYQFSCKQGYSLVGTNTLYCNDQGNWNGSVPSCLIECPQLPFSIPNGHANGTGSLHGALIVYSCLQGYSLIGQKTLLCTEDGNWNASVPKCLKDCPTLPSLISHGFVNGTGSVEGSRHHFSCDEGYSLVGQHILHCGKDGSWNGSVPTCLIECPRLPYTIQHGNINGSGHVEGSLRRFTCNDGYSLVGKDVLYCTEMGQWNASVPICLRECPIPPSSITHGFVHGSGSLEGDRYRSMCEPGYSLIGDDTLVCTDTGVWNGSFPTCLIECPQLPSTLKHGTVNGSGHVEGSLHRFTCNDGYSLVGQDVLYCTEMGQWNTSVPTCLRECPSLPSVIAHGFVNGSGSLEGAGYEFSCEGGYSLIGDSLVVCTDAGVWNGSLPTCLIECPVLPLSIRHGDVNGSGSVQGSVYRFTCRAGYSLMGEQNLHCTEEGRWNASVPSCLKDCPVLPSSIPNGFVNGNGSVEGSQYKFSCRQGYSLVGRETLFCNHKGAWSGAMPKCLKDCPSLADSIDNGYKHGSGSVEGSLAWFSCKDGFSLIGNQYLYCNEKGYWNGTTPSCLKEPNGAVTARVEGLKAIESPCEQDALGAAEGGKLSSVDFTASSSFPSLEPSYGRLNGPLAWCSLGFTAGEEYLEIHVPEAESICAIATQGNGYIEGEEHVREYQVEHSEDGILWKEIGEEPGKIKVFEGNRDSKSVSKQVLPVPVEATYVRIFPLQFHGWICMRVELYGREKTPRAPFPAVAEAESFTVTLPLPTTTVKRKDMDIGILIDSSSGVTDDEFRFLKSFILQLVKSIHKKFSNVQFGIVAYSNKPDLVMPLQKVDRIKVKSIIEGVKYNPGGHRTDLAMLLASQKLFCPKGCDDRPEVENVLIVFTSGKTDAESLPYNLVSPMMKNCTSNIVAVGISHNVSKSELIKIALGSPDRALKVESPDHLNSEVISKIEGVL